MEKYGNFHKIFALACINSGYVIHGEDQVVMYIELVDYSMPLRSKKESIFDKWWIIAAEK